MLTKKNDSQLLRHGEAPNSSLFTLSFQKRSDEHLEFDYVILLHDMVSQVKSYF